VKSALLSSKAKTITCLARGAEIVMTAENPSAERIAKIAPKQSRITKEDILDNRSNVAERLGYLGRVVHGGDPRAWLKKKGHTLVRRLIVLSCDASRKTK
jgi:hypothetical protein